MLPWKNKCAVPTNPLAEIVFSLNLGIQGTLGGKQTWTEDLELHCLRNCSFQLLSCSHIILITFPSVFLGDIKDKIKKLRKTQTHECLDKQ